MRLCFILLMALLYFRFVPGDALALVLTPAAFFLRMPLRGASGPGLIRGPVSAVSAILGDSRLEISGYCQNERGGCL